MWLLFLAELLSNSGNIPRCVSWSGTISCLGMARSGPGMGWGSLPWRWKGSGPVGRQRGSHRTNHFPSPPTRGLRPHSIWNPQSPRSFPSLPSTKCPWGLKTAREIQSHGLPSLKVHGALKASNSYLLSLLSACFTFTQELLSILTTVLSHPTPSRLPGANHLPPLKQQISYLIISAENRGHSAGASVSHSLWTKHHPSQTLAKAGSRAVRTSPFRDEGPDLTEALKPWYHSFQCTPQDSPPTHRPFWRSGADVDPSLLADSDRPGKAPDGGCSWSKGPAGRLLQKVDMIFNYPRANEPAESTRPLLGSRNTYLPV